MGEWRIKLIRFFPLVKKRQLYEYEYICQLIEMTIQYMNWAPIKFKKPARRDPIQKSSKLITYQPVLKEVIPVHIMCTDQ